MRQSYAWSASGRKLRKVARARKRATATSEKVAPVSEVYDDNAWYRSPPSPSPAKREKDALRKASTALERASRAVVRRTTKIAFENVVLVPGALGVLINVSPLLDDDIPLVGELRLVREAFLKIQSFAARLF